MLLCSNSATLQLSISRAHLECTQRFAGANFTAGGRELFWSRSREAGDSVLVNGARGTRDIEGKATRVGASELGKRASFKSVVAIPVPKNLCPFETRSAPASLGATLRAFTFCLGNPISSAVWIRG